MSEECMVSIAIENLAARWTVQILFCIHFELNRFGLIKARLPWVSDQILGLRLRQLVANKLVLKKVVDDEKTYVISEKGRKLIPILDQLAECELK
jgi:DNA-binding HxlR family transcriptional regulator